MTNANTIQTERKDLSQASPREVIQANLAGQVSSLRNRYEHNYLKQCLPQLNQMLDKEGIKDPETRKIMAIIVKTESWLTCYNVNAGWIKKFSNPKEIESLIPAATQQSTAISTAIDQEIQRLSSLIHDRKTRKLNVLESILSLFIPEDKIRARDQIVPHLEGIKNQLIDKKKFLQEDFQSFNNALETNQKNAEGVLMYMKIRNGKAAQMEVPEHASLIKAEAKYPDVVAQIKKDFTEQITPLMLVQIQDLAKETENLNKNTEQKAMIPNPTSQVRSIPCGIPAESNQHSLTDTAFKGLECKRDEKKRNGIS